MTRGYVWRGNRGTGEGDVFPLGLPFGDRTLPTDAADGRMDHNVLETVWNMLTTVAQKVGDGTGFWIIFGSYMTMMLGERLIFAFSRNHDWNEREARANLLNQLLNEAVGALLTGTLFMGIYVLVYEQARLFDIPFIWWGWVLAFLLNDLAYYVDHRIAHRTGFFWAFHIPHHSSQEMNLLVSPRGSIFGLGGVMSPTYFLLALIGLNPLMFLAAKFFGNLWGIFNHTRLVHRMGFLEGILATPANHRVHHGIEPKYLDKNYGQTLILWDRMFNSWQREEEEPTYGLVKQMNSHRIWDIQTWGIRWLFGQIRSADRWQDKLMYLIKPPGWNHNGRHEMTETIVRGEQILPAE
jgi:sterol desaturase/sphingolipid hydroxylase (fatty acid hydroxylase superfamily)